MLYSHSKSFTSTVVGFLVDDGRLDLDERVVDLLPDSLPGTLSDNLRQLRVRDLLTMNMGADRTDAECDDIAGDWVKAILANGFQHAPGTRFKYDSAATHLLAAIVERMSGKRLMDFLRERLFAPLGMDSPWSTTSPTGIACGGWGMNMTTRALAVFGQFLLQKGVWKGQRLLSEDWVSLATSKQTRSKEIVVGAKTIGSGDDWAQGYGFQFWRCQHGAFRADGASGQLTVVFPSSDAVVSVNAGLGNMQRELDLIWKHLLPAFAADPLPPDVEAQMELKRKCESLALPLSDSLPKVFEGMDAAQIEAADGGWRLRRGDAVLNVGDGGWKITEWRFTDDNVEPLFGKCGVRKIAAAISQLYRDRGDCENNFDEFKNQWGWAGFTTHKLKPCKVMARLIAIVANWWNVFCRLADPTAHREATTSRPAYMSIMGRIVESGRRRTIHLTSTHADSTLIQRALDTVAAFFRWLGSTAEQLDEKTRWTIVVRYAFRRILLPDPALKPLYALK